MVCRRGGFDLSWVRVFVDVPIANDSEALLQDRVLVLCGVGTRHYDVVAMYTGRDGLLAAFVIRLYEKTETMSGLQFRLLPYENKILNGLQLTSGIQYMFTTNPKQKPFGHNSAVKSSLVWLVSN